MSGMTRSIPSISSSGNISPASTTMRSSPSSSASMFLPISPTPPSGMTRSGALGLAKERDLLRRDLFRLARRGRGGEEQREGCEIGVQRGTQRRLVERGGGVVHGEHHEPVGGLTRLAGGSGDRLPREDLAHRVAAQ